MGRKNKKKPKAGPAPKPAKPEVDDENPIEASRSATPIETSRGDVPRPALAVNWGKLVSFLVLIFVICVIGIFSLRVMQAFLLPLFLAALMVVIFRPVNDWFLEKCGGRTKIAAALTTLAVLTTVLGPICWATKLAIQEGAVVAAGDWNLSERLDTLRSQFGLQLPYRDEFESLQSQLMQVMPTPEDRVPDWQPTEKQIAILAQMCSELDALEKKFELESENDPGRSEAVQTHMATVRQALDKARDSAASLRESPNVENAQAYDKSVLRVGVHLDRVGDAMSGGFPQSFIVHFANPTSEELQDWQTQTRDYLQHWLLSITGKSTALIGNLLFGLAIMLIAIYYFLVDGPEMIKAGMRLSPLDDHYEEELLVEFGKVSRAVVLATLLSAIVQGLLAGIGYFFAGLEPVVLLTVLTMMLAMVPFVGAAAVWVPVALYVAFIENRMTAGIALGVYGALIVSMADNVIKPMVLHGQSNLHPLLALLSVLGGVQALGPIGILVGPMLLAFLQALLNMLRKEISSMSTA